MPEQMDIGQRISKSLGYDAGRQAFDIGSSQRLIATLPLMNGVKKEALIAHEMFIYYDVYNVNIKIVKKRLSRNHKKRLLSCTPLRDLILGRFLDFTDTVPIKAIIELVGFNKGTGTG